MSADGGITIDWAAEISCKTGRLRPQMLISRVFNICGTSNVEAGQQQSWRLL